MKHQKSRSYPRNDGSYALGAVVERERRQSMLRTLHISPLTDWVEATRSQTGLGLHIPYFDPLDGGAHARVLFLLEAPGPKAVSSGFISRDNPDPTARNFRMLLAEAGIPREASALWNIVPWYIGSGEKIRPAMRSDIDDGRAHLPGLLAQFSRLEALVLVGRKAQQARERIQRLTSARIFESFHPSNQVVTCWPEKRECLRNQLQEVAQFLGTSSSKGT